MINPLQIKVPFTELKKVIHISDIHIRLFRRHAEYRQVFEKLYSQISRMVDDVEESVILITGDILHAKIDLSPEAVQLTSEFFKKLADISPMLITAGNHDLNVSNAHRLDSLSPIIQNIDHPNIYYLKDSGVYTVADADFAVYSLIGVRENWPSIEDCKSPHKIAVMHDAINDAITDTGYTITSRRIDASAFDGYHMVMLGDIHKHQILQAFDGPSRYPLIAYAGSLIQQNHGENLEGHGLIEWDIPTRTLEHRAAANEYGYATITVADGKVPDLSNIPDKCRLRVFVKNMTAGKVKKVESILRRKFDVQEFVVNRTRDTHTIETDEITSSILQNVQDTATQNELIEEYLIRHNFGVSDKLMSRIHELNVELNSRLVASDLPQNIQWTPLLFEFNNMFSYGEDNDIAFHQMQGVHGLFSPNASGKTAAFDALMFCLYDKTPRAFKASHIMNNRKDVFECCLTFDVNGTEYGISRKGTRKNNRDVKVNVEFWKMKRGKKILLTAEDRRSTNAIIRQYVGTYEDLILTNVSIQNNNALFIDKRQSERKDLLSQFIGCNVLDTLCQLALEEMKESQGALKRMNREEYAKSLVQLQTDIDARQSEYDGLEKTRKSVSKKLSTVEQKITKLYESKTPLSLKNLNIVDLESTKEDLMKSLEELEEKTSNFEIQKVELKATSGSQAAVTHELRDTETEHEDAQVQQTQLTLAKSKLGNLEKQISTGQAQLDHLTEHEYDPDCDFCTRNNQSLVEQSGHLAEELEENRLAQKLVGKQADSLLAKLMDFGEVVVNYKLFQTARSSAQTAHTELLSIVASISNLKAKRSSKRNRLKDAQRDIDAYHHSIHVIEANATIDGKIKVLEVDQQKFSGECDLLETNSRDVHGKLQVHKANKKQILEDIAEMEDLEEVISAYEFYVEAVKRDGIPYELISKVLPSIQAEINNILSQIADFTITLDVDGRNINGNLSYGDDRHWPLEMSSGMERFIGSLAIRVALISISNLPKPNFLIIDEGLGTLHKDNLPHMSTLFTILKDQFDFIIIISHLEAVRDMVDNLMEIQIDDGYSKINY